MEVEKRLSVEDLMKPRYMVIADYPEIERHNIRLGDIIIREENAMYADTTQEGTPVVSIDHEIFPANFKKLEWWEERKVSDMPRYVKVNTEKSSLFFGNVHKVTEWFKRGDGLACRIEERKDPMYSFSVEHFTPATESEYLILNK